jgi:hypothetical protein
MEFLAGQSWIMTNFCGPRQYFFFQLLDGASLVSSPKQILTQLETLFQGTLKL